MKPDVRCNAGAMQVLWMWEEHGRIYGGWSAQPRGKVETRSGQHQDKLNFTGKFRR
ncbi:MAG: hypothetical protein U0T36_09005 [Saprospiraceae bacterium]